MSSETKFTPGKWCVPDQTYRVQLTVDVAGENLIACPGSGGAMSYTETVCTLNWSGTDEWMANAHLIAAAPVLYEALPDLSHVIAWLENGCDPKKAAQELRIYANGIDAAKAKARGES